VEWKVIWTDNEGNEQTYLAYKKEWAIDKKTELIKQGINAKVIEFDWNGNATGEVKINSNNSMFIPFIGAIIAGILFIAAPQFFMYYLIGILALFILSQVIQFAQKIGSQSMIVGSVIITVLIFVGLFVSII
jgi:hypothetical protein